MKNQKIYADENLCSRVWLNPINSNREGVQKIGLEMEMHAYDAKTLAPLGTEGSELSPQNILERIEQLPQTQKVLKDAHTPFYKVVSLKNGGNFSVEPGGQIEYSSAPCETLSELAREVSDGLRILESVTQGSVVFLSHGTNPIAAPNHPLVLAKERYQIMTRYFNSAPGVRGLDMMRHSATVQANLDIFGNVHWHDAVNLMLVLVPITAGLFANSRYFKGQKSAFASERQEIWKHMDPSRSGFPKDLLFAQNPECAYARWAKEAFVFYIEELPAAEQPLYDELTFNQWMQKGYKGTRPSVQDWENHLGTLFPHLRLRDFLEIRHIDAQPFEHTFAPIAFFASILMCEKSRQRTWDLLRREGVDVKNILAHQNDDYSALHVSLLKLSCEILAEYNETEGQKAVAAYAQFLKQKEAYFAAKSAHDFVVRHKTTSPSREFQKHLTP